MSRFWKINSSPKGLFFLGVPSSVVSLVCFQEVVYVYCRQKESVAPKRKQ